MTRLRVVHTSAFDYPGPVAASYNETRMAASTVPGQLVLAFALDIEPVTWSHEYRDHWGTAVTAFEVLAPHEQLTITATSLVEVSDRTVLGFDATWQELASGTLREEMAEYLAPTRMTEVPDEVVEFAEAAIGDLAPHDAARAVCDAVRGQLDYIPGVTAVHSPATEAWAARSGVCQDMAHLAIGALRAVGVPARYVSGYLHPLREEAAVGQTALGESHAWIEWWAGDWHGYDPTNSAAADEFYVVVARGREYSDVPPFKGVYAGKGPAEMSVEVSVTREA